MDSLGGRERERGEGSHAVQQRSLQLSDCERGTEGTGVHTASPIAAVILPPSAELFPYPTESERVSERRGEQETKEGIVLL